MNKKGFTLIELLVVVAIIALLIAILLPSLQKARELSKQTACRANVKSIGTSCYIYQEDNLGVFPTVPHAGNASATPLVNYVGNMGGGPDCNEGGVNDDPCRSAESTNEPPGSTNLSPTRSLWLMVRSGSMVPKNFLCPSSDDITDPTVDVTTYYDFIGFGTCSYGYQIPYDDVNPAKPSADVDPRMVLVADRGPWSARDGNAVVVPDPVDAYGVEFFRDKIGDFADTLYNSMMTEPIPDEHSPPDVWRKYNSPNHGGQAQGQGQSVLYPDGHAEFASTPLAGVDTDNIYTKMDVEAGSGGWTGVDFRHAMQIGNYPGNGSEAVLPGFFSFGDSLNSMTDSLIYP